MGCPVGTFYRACIQKGDGHVEGGPDNLDNLFVTSHFELNSANASVLFSFLTVNTWESHTHCSLTLYGVCLWA